MEAQKVRWNEGGTEPASVRAGRTKLFYW